MHRTLAALAFTFLLLPGRSLAATDDQTFEKIAKKLTDQAAPKLKTKKIVVLPFDYTDKRVSPGSSYVSDGLIDQFVSQDTFSVIERAAVEKLLGELKFQNTGAIDAQTAQEIGKGLGADAIVTGTLTDAKGGQRTIVHARIIETDSFKILGSARGVIDKAWAEGKAPQDQNTSSKDQISEPASASRPQATANDELVVFNTKTFKYHCASCTWAIRCTRSCITIPLSEAIQRGGIPCKVCGGRCNL